MREIESIIQHRQREPQRTIIQAVTRVCAYEIRVQGKENLQETRKLIAQGGKLVMAPNHSSNADYPVLAQSLKSNAPEIARNTVPLWGKKLRDNKVTNFLSGGYNRILVWPPTIQPTSEERKEFVSMTRQAREEAKHVLDIGRHLVIFLEGTRSRTGNLQEGDPRAEVYLDLVPNEFVLPIGLIGTRQLLRPGTPFPLPHKLDIVYGKPIPVANLKKGSMVNDIMLEIAKLLPPIYRGVYANET